MYKKDDEPIYIYEVHLDRGFTEKELDGLWEQMRDFFESEWGIDIRGTWFRRYTK